MYVVLVRVDAWLVVSGRRVLMREDELTSDLEDVVVVMSGSLEVQLDVDITGWLAET